MKKLNKIHMSAATLALVLAACSEQADFTQADIANAAIENANAGDVPVAFSTYVGTAGTTRATNPASNGSDISDNTKLQTAHFGVFAYLTKGDYFSTDDDKPAPNFMYNQEVTYTDPNWVYTPVKYWPNGTDAANGANDPSNTAVQDNTYPKLLSFFAYAPYVASDATTPATDDGIITLPTNNTANVRPIITYKLPSTPTASNTVDLLWGIRGQRTYDETDGSKNTVDALTNDTYNENLTKQTTTERVRFLFKHALAKIGAIQVVADLDGNSSTPTTSGFDDEVDPKTLITLTSVDIKDNGASVNASGSFDISRGTWTSTTKVASDGTQVAAEITKATTNVNSYVWEPNSGSVAYTAESTNKWTTPTAPTTGVQYSGVVPTELRDLYSTGNFSPIMFIPGSGQQLKIAVTYIVRTYDSKLDPTTASSGEGKWSKVTQTITNVVSLPNLQPNTNYTLVMHLGLTSVKFSAVVADWDGGSTEVIWLPSNVVTTSAITIPASTSTTSVNAAWDATTYEVTLTNLTPSATYTLAIGSGSTSGITFTPAAGSVTAGADGTLKVTVGGFAANSNNTQNTITAKIQLTKDATTTTNTVEIVQAAKP